MSDSNGSDKPFIDSELVKQAKARNKDAFGSLYMQLYSPIRNFLVKKVEDEGVACELTQETFLIAWQKLPDLLDVSKFVGWLYRIARNKALDYLRSNKHIRWERLDEELGSIEGGIVTGPEEEIEAKEHIREALAGIPWKYRACLILYHKENWSLSQIAKLLQIQESSVKTYLSYGLKALQDFLKDDNTY